MNQVFLIGNLGKDPELRYTQNGQAVCNFSIAVNERYKAGEDWKTKTEWVNIVVWGKTAEYCGENLLKGHKVFIQGKIQTRSYDDKNGQKRYITEIVAAKVEHFQGVPTTNGQEESRGAPSSAAGAQPNLDDDVPFVLWEDFRHDRWVI